MTTFLPGLELSELFYREAVKPILDVTNPGLRYSAALIGRGSEVLGFDTPQSMDHHWGPRLQLFVPEDQHEELAASIHVALSVRLPREIAGFPTNFGPPDGFGVRLLQPVKSGPVHHMVEVTTIDRFFCAALGVTSRQPITNRDWLLFPQQRLLEITQGRIFHDDMGLEAARSRFMWYPHDVWLYLLSAQWTRIGQEEPFVGRTGDVGDDMGSAITAARLVRDLMRLVFLMERRYAPYTKWLGTAFSRLTAAPSLEPVLRAVLAAPTWQEREQRLSEAYGIVARMHNDLQLTQPFPTDVSSFHERPYQVIHAERFAAALKERIGDVHLWSLADMGGIDQVTDNTNVLSNPRLFRSLRGLYERHDPQ